MADITILAQPEPIRSTSLRELGMTEDEFRALMEGWAAKQKESEEDAARNGESSGMHYGDDFPTARIVD